MVSMEMALVRYGVMLHRIDRCYLRGRCPLPNHVSKGSRLSFIVNIEKNAWACHSGSCIAARGGRIGGNVLDFVASMENCSIREAALRLQDWFNIACDSAEARRNIGGITRLQPAASVRMEPQDPLAATSADHNPPLSFRLRSIDVHHPYLAERRVSAETADHFGIGFFAERGYMQGRIVIPIHDEDGRLVAYAGRSLDATEPRYRFPPRFRKSLVLFNLHRAVLQGKTVVVVEGFFDCLTVYQAGLPCVVALMGCSLSPHQEQLLHDHFEEVVLLLDGDNAGRKAGAAIAARLCSRVSTRLVEIPAGSQPDQLGADQIRCLCIRRYF
jgi:DNA primase